MARSSAERFIEETIGRALRAIAEWITNPTPDPIFRKKPRPHGRLLDEAHHQEAKRTKELREIEKAWKTLNRINHEADVSTRTFQWAKRAVRLARSRTHPDRHPRSKSARDFLLVQRAADVLGHEYGTKL